MKDKIILVITAITCVALGLFLGLEIKFWPITFSNIISLGQIPGFLLPVVLAVYIPFFLNSRINNKRVEKDILIEVCNKQENELQDLRKLIDEAYLASGRIKKDIAKKILLKTKRISKSLSLLEKSLKEYGSSGIIKNTVSALKTSQISCWENLTFHLADRTPKFDEAKFVIAEESMYDYSENLIKLELLINKS